MGKDPFSERRGEGQDSFAGFECSLLLELSTGKVATVSHHQNARDQASERQGHPPQQPHFWLQPLAQMSLSSPSALLRFLHSAKSAVLSASTGSLPALSLHIGNESCDADSIVSSILSSYTHSLKEGAAASARQHVPVISTNKKEFKLRREATFLLEQATSASSKEVEESLLFQDDLPAVMQHLQALAAEERLNIVLLDHNSLTGPLKSAGLQACVSEIIDHHKDMGEHGHVTGSALRRVSFDPAISRGVGSTCTLVAEDMLQLLEAGVRVEDEQQLLQLLYGVILIDTINLSAVKSIPQDHAVVAALEGHSAGTAGAGAGAASGGEGAASDASAMRK